MLHTDHILASISDVFNAVLIEGDAVGPVLLYGKGAGEMPTASAVIADLVDIFRNITENAPKRIPMHFYRSNNAMQVLPVSRVSTRYYLRFSVVDKPKVMAAISTVLGEHNISIASVIQKEGTSRDFVPVIILTSEAIEENLQNAVSEIENLDIVKQKTQIIRIEE